MIKKIPVKKLGMTSAFDGAGTTVPVTLVEPLEVVVTELKRPEKHGYSAIQAAYGEVLPKRLNKPHLGTLKRAGVDSALSHLYESRVAPEELEGLEPGQQIRPQELLSNWGEVKVSGISKGKGFAGVVKRWGFRGQCRTHGDPDNRRPMSNNATDPARVFKGSRRPGRMGNKLITVKRATVFDYDPELNVLALTGSVPGPNGGTLIIDLVSERHVEED